jgi:hypothetical protein
MPSALATTILAVVIAVPGMPARAAGEVYRCVDPRLGVLYTDEPCPGGARVALPPREEGPSGSGSPQSSAKDGAGGSRGADEERAVRARIDAELARYGWSPSATLVPWPPRAAR